MNSEQQFARQICRVLDLGTRSIEPVVAERLRAARERALQRQLFPVQAIEILGAGGSTVLQTGWFGDSGRTLRSLLSILALLLGVSLSYYWNGYVQAGVNEEIDSALLAGDLPPSAYLDRGFQIWLENNSPAGE
ncbi:MAG: DUF3619 family protein [Gammaproteobacteria bacterium]|nr:DUF3619 family protein [Rhodocyclaceae bacterium]MBU3910460.1 DUF3619 family protein [Gammaproteobacteria bacterium]MBU4004941.1 DUF3619 family protein [Gammaproteobacteria bacterium]MBU4020534.1 DUF3619 family protein [Gammaproteobacteria bacterium]MBU4095610.1 DUF3619 family protein [Gammaproteobacteria bacterium]